MPASPRREDLEVFFLLPKQLLGGPCVDFGTDAVAWCQGPYVGFVYELAPLNDFPIKK